MIKSGKGGGNTRTGLVFEGKTDLATFLNSQPHYSVNEHKVFYDNEKVAEVYKKHSFYKVFFNTFTDRLETIYIKAVAAR